MSKTIVLVHGRRQEFKDPNDLTRMWLDGLDIGLRSAGLAAVDRATVTMPFYGNELYRITEESASVRIRLESASDEPGPFHPAMPPDVGRLERELLREQALAAGVSALAPDGELRQEGLESVLSWGPARRILDSLSRRTRVDQAIITDYLRDVAVYLSVGREAILSCVRSGIPAEGEIVLLSHSLGTVIARDLLVDDSLRHRTTLWVTAGSPLGLDAVRKNLSPGGSGNPGLTWVSAYDVNDIVAIGHPLAPKWGMPAVLDIEVENGSEPHDIAKYLAHTSVAKHIAVELNR